jgi:AAA domain
MVHMQAIVFIGIQACGKSTFYHHQFGLTHVRINLDMLKTRYREQRVFETCLEIQQSFVIDNTNPTRLDRFRYIEPAKQYQFQVIGYYFESRVQEAIDRNQQRPLAQQIPDKGNGINFNDLPLWQRRGVGCYWETYMNEGFNPIANQQVLTERQRIKVDMELPMQDKYSEFIRYLIETTIIS